MNHAHPRGARDELARLRRLVKLTIAATLTLILIGGDPSVRAAHPVLASLSELRYRTRKTIIQSAGTASA